MLMTMLLMLTFMATSYKLKSSWEMTIIILSMMSMSLLLYLQPNSSPHMYSESTMLDSMSLIMIMLSMWITSLMFMASYMTKLSSTKYMFILTLLLLLLTLSSCFLINNLIMFYIMFEASLIPTLLLIIMWGAQTERVKASFYMMMYTISASLPLLMMIMKLTTSSFHMTLILNYTYPLPLMNMQLLWMMTMLAFLIKLPIFSMHTWLPKAHVEAPVAGSMVLAAILLKLGAYGLMRMNTLLNQPMFSTSYMIMLTAITGALITNIICIRQTDLKALIAYSSIGHMGLLIMSTLSNSKMGQYGGLILMLTHGLSSSCLFLLVNNSYEKLSTRNIMLTNMTNTITPSTSLLWMLTIMANMALPPSLNILGEITIMMSSFFIFKPLITMLMIASLSTSMYSLYLFSMISHGNQLKLNNYITQMSSNNITSLMVHLWPLLVLITMPTKMLL